MFLLGYTRYKGLHHPLAGIDIFRQLINRYPNSSSARIAALCRADCHLALGEPVVAESLYLEIPMRSLPQNFQEELLFRKGELYFFLGEYDAAREAYGEMMNSFPKSIYVNDALRRIMLISDHPDMGEVVLRRYSEALYAQFRFEFDSALVILDKLKQIEGSSLAQLSWLKAGEIYIEKDLPQQALEQFDSLIARFPESNQSVFAVERKGDVYADLIGDYDKARETYESLLLEHPASLNEEQVRKKLNRVEQLIAEAKNSPKS
jgi:tetratricopeptide (TPR) repeat protein